MQYATAILSDYRRGAPVDNDTVVGTLRELKRLRPSPQVVNAVTQLEGIVIVHLMRAWEVDVDNLLKDYNKLPVRTQDTYSEIQTIHMRSLVSSAKVLREATVLSNPERTQYEQVKKRMRELDRLIDNLERVVGVVD